ncbi:MAG: nucleoside triphosphate pyrophosphohydrolase [Bacteroidota bacterium]
MNKNDKRLDAFQRLLDIMDELRAKCPWDKKQTFDTLRHLTIEETYELADAIIEKNSDEIKGELGDLMLHIVFYSKIASEQGAFDITNVLDGICDKLIQRHPHIFGDVVANDALTVLQNWEKIKLDSGKKSVLQGVPKSLPAMVKAYRIQDKAKGVGFDWEEPNQVWDKVREELDELHEQVEKNTSQEKIRDEFGDVFFALINYARFIDVEPDAALERTNKKFIRRFQYLEEGAKKAGKKLSDMTLAEMDVFWNEAKSME